MISQGRQRKGRESRDLSTTWTTKWVFSPGVRGKEGNPGIRSIQTSPYWAAFRQHDAIHLTALGHPILTHNKETPSSCVRLLVTTPSFCSLLSTPHIADSILRRRPASATSVLRGKLSCYSSLPLALVISLIFLLFARCRTWDPRVNASWGRSLFDQRTAVRKQISMH